MRLGTLSWLLGECGGFATTFPCLLLVFDLFPSREVLPVVMASRLVTCSIRLEATLMSV